MGMSGGPLVAGVDSSTTATKVVVRDAETGALVRSGRAEHPPGTEVPPSAWWRAFGTASLGVTVHDHLIIGRGRHTSLRDMGLIG